MHNWKKALANARPGESKYKLLVQAVAADIEQGTLIDGQRLPPQRQVSDALGISVQTVTNAYKELERQGRVRCEVGRGSFVSRRTSERVAFPTRASCIRLITTACGDRPAWSWRRSRTNRGFTPFARLPGCSTSARPRCAGWRAWVWMSASRMYC